MSHKSKIAAQIIEQGGDYVLALKGNQGTLAAEVEEAFIGADAKDYSAPRCAVRGCSETRKVGKGKQSSETFAPLCLPS